MGTQALVTIVIPNYNHAAYLEQRIDSVLNQSFQDFELYILDDYSTDQSIDVINNYKDHIKVKSIIRNSSNSGTLFKQWVKAINLSKGKYLWIAESDDFSHPDFLQETVAIAEQHQDIGLVFTDTNIVNASGVFIEKVSKVNNILSNSKEAKFIKIEDRNKVLNNFISDLIIWNASSVLFKTNALKKIDLNLIQSLKNAGDLFTYISIALKNNIIYLNMPLNYYRSHDNNTTKKNIASGSLFGDRQTIIIYFIKELHELENSKSHLKSFFSRNFLTAIDFKLYKKVNKLLKAYYNYKIISLFSYLHLSLYIFCSRVFRKTPYKYRSYIKSILAK